jgi:hypothetical protein
VSLATHVRTAKARLGPWLGRRRPRPFSDAARRRVLLLTEAASIPQSQVFPFHFYRRELEARAGVELREMLTLDFEARPESAPAPADVVCVQTWFDLAPERCERLFTALRARCPSAKIVFLDWYAPTDLRLASMLDPHIDLYVKKHVFRDRSRYGQETRGDTNLVEYYSALYGFEASPVTFPVTAGFLRKLVVGPSFFTSAAMLPHFHSRRAPTSLPRRFDVHARLGGSGGGWYQTMRERAATAAQALEGHVLTGAGIGQRRYMRELRASRLCFSPFGYGEVCWRDYEAVMCGAVLVKPDMAHVETSPDIFLPGETYLPVAWDFADLSDKVSHALKRDTEMARIAQRAHDILHRHVQGSAPIEQLLAMLRP